MTSLMTFLRRGLFSGLIASFIAAGFSYFLAEPVMDRAVELESAREATEITQQAAGLSVDRHVDVFSRPVQHAGLVVATLATGLALGALFAVVYWIVYWRDPHKAVWGRSLWLAASAFTAVWLLPFLRYPANPPGVGDPATVNFRTSIWLAAMAIGIGSVVTAWWLYNYLTVRDISVPVRQLSVTGLLTAALAFLFILPANPDSIEVPAALLWDFRLLSLATMLILWAVLGTSFGLLGRRAVY